MADGTVGPLGEGDKRLDGIVQRREMGEGQTDLERDHLGEHPENKQRRVAAEGIAADRLRSIIERVERLEEERKALAGDIKDIWTEAKSAGFDVTVCKQIIRVRRQDPAEAEEQETLFDVYKRALGM